MASAAHEARMTAEAQRDVVEAGQRVIQLLGLDLPDAPTASKYRYLKTVNTNQWVTAILSAVVEAWGSTTLSQAEGSPSLNEDPVSGEDAPVRGAGAEVADDAPGGAALEPEVAPEGGTSSADADSDKVPDEDAPKRSRSKK